MRLMNRRLNLRAEFRATAIAILMALPAIGCSSYTLRPITAAAQTNVLIPFSVPLFRSYPLFRSPLVQVAATI
jgi:hypothetical protein